MTNGEKLRVTFPKLKITILESYVQVMGENYEFCNAYPLEWWNAEYEEPTTTYKRCKFRKRGDVGDYYCNISGEYCDIGHHLKCGKR